MEEDLKESKNKFTEWLEVLQQESWQLELLISGFAIYGIWASNDLLQSAINYISINKPSEGIGVVVVIILVLMLKAGWVIFFINLLIHVSLRGLWIGAIGLRYVSGNIDYDILGFSDYFTNYFKKKVENFDDYIERLEKICSVIFAYTFLLFFLFISFAFFLIFTILLGKIMSLIFTTDATIYIVFTFLGFALFVFVDFITLGVFKKVKNKTFSKFYSYIYRFFSAITLSFIYRPLLYNFIDYKYTRRLFWFSIPYVVVITLVLPNFVLEANPFFPSTLSNTKQYNKTSIHTVDWNNYDDLRENHFSISKENRRKIDFISLSNYRIKDSYASIFIKQLGSDEKLLMNKYSISPYRKSGLRNKILGLSIKDSVIINLDKQRSADVLKLIRDRKKNKKSNKKKDYGLVSEFKRGYNGIKSDHEKDSINAYWYKRKEEAKEYKLLSIKNAMLDISKIYIDGKPFNKFMSCKFYEYPNLNEKGLLCDFSIDSLSIGEHILTLDRSIYSKNSIDSIAIKTINLPFWILKKYNN